MLAHDVLLERAVLRGEKLIKGGAQHRDGATTGRNRSFVRSRVNSLGESAHNDGVATDKVLGKRPGVGKASRGCLPRAHDGHARAPLEERAVARDEERPRGVLLLDLVQWPEEILWVELIE